MLGWPMRVVVKLHRGAELFDATLVQDDDAVGHGHRLDLVVGDVDHRRVEVALQGAEFDAHLASEGGVEVGERLVEEEDLGVAHDAAADGDTLALAAGKLAGFEGELLGQLQDVGGAADLLLDLCLGQAGDAQGKGDVFKDRQVGVKRIALEHHRDAAVHRGSGRDIDAVDHDAAGGRGLKPGDDAQKGGLAAARGADEHDEFLVADRKVDAVQHLGRAEGFRDALQVKRGHAGGPLW
jgi:hypothetical protein